VPQPAKASSLEDLGHTDHSLNYLSNGSQTADKKNSREEYEAISN